MADKIKKSRFSFCKEMDYEIIRASSSAINGTVRDTQTQNTKINFVGSLIPRLQTMSRSSDLLAFIRGLECITKALLKHQGRECRTVWKNSSLKMATRGLGGKVEELVSDVIVKGSKVKTRVRDQVEFMASQAVSIFENIRDKGSEIVGGVQEVSQSDVHRERSEDYERGSLSEDFILQAAISQSADRLSNDLSPLSERTSPADDNMLNMVGRPLHSNGISSDNQGEKKSFHYDSGASGSTADDVMKEKLSHKDGSPVQQKQPLRTSPPPPRINQKLSERARERRVPGSRVGRMMSFGSLAAGLGVGAVAEVTRRTLGLKPDNVGQAILDSSPFLTEANAERIVNTLCRVRGAALKLGQMLSIQDNSFLNPELQKIFERVRQSADFMPIGQMEKVLYSELGPDWRSKLESFDEKPFAAASIGQVHRATLLDGREVALKIQYPGVASSIDSDINNLMGVLKVWNILPKGMYVENVMTVARVELAWEVDYIREAECCRRFRKLLENDPAFHVPEVIDELSTKKIITTELVNGTPLDKVVSLDQDIKDRIGSNILRLCLRELFEFRFMQTDPNWANFFYNYDTDQICLLDFGASREFSKKFVDKYIEVIYNAKMDNRQGVLRGSQELGFLTGYEAKVMEDVHIDAVMILGEAFACKGKYNFGSQMTTARIQNLIPVMLKYRLSAPPDESYSLHRKMSGAFLLCSKLGCQIDCNSLFMEIWNNYKFGDVETTL